MSARISSSSRVPAVEIRTPPALAAIANKFAPVILQENDTPVPPANSDYFGRMMLPTNIELDSGNYHVYDVQSDTRFVKNYIEYHIATLFPEMNIKGHPYVTPLSLAGYCFHLFYAHMLTCDAVFRPTKSYQAARFLSDADKKDLHDKLLQSRVPTFFADLLLELAPVYDPRRNNHLFCPTLAGYSHLHDFGRTIPASLYYAAHHLLASTRTNKDPDDVIDDVMEITLIEHNQIEYKVSNYLGTWYNHQHHPNFVNQDFLAFFNPLVGRALTQRPTFARLPFVHETLELAAAGNIYTTLLLASDENLNLTTTMIDAISAFVLSDNKSAPQLGSVIATLSGTLLLSHSIEPPTMPTWTAFEYTQEVNPNQITDRQFATDHGYLSEPTAGTAHADYPTDDDGLDTTFYHIAKQSTFDPATRAVKHVLFDGRISVAPAVLYFQPYDVSPSSLGLTIALGIKIELSEIAGFMVPTERPEDSLDDNNSLTMLSAISLDKIKPLFAQKAIAQSRTMIMQRKGIDSTQQPLMLALRTMIQNIFPVFHSVNLPAALSAPATNGLAVENNHYSTWTGFNVKSGSNGIIQTKEEHFHLWSSYRIVRKYKAPEPKDILFVATFRPHYGVNVTLSRSKNPALLIPH